ncbi:MAG: AtpZ/AtpI family protein [Acidobacteria bacterium]|nr:AtpZ/AtpI family protein [Acidobacteriota bacterium]
MRPAPEPGKPDRASRGRNTVYAKAGAYTGLAFVIPAAMYAGYWLGGHADAGMGTNYWSTVGLMLGFGAGLYEVYRQAVRIERIGRQGKPGPAQDGE